MGVRGSSGVVSGLAVLAGCALLAGCGGSSSPRSAPRKPLGERVCDGARQAAAKALGAPLAARVVSPAAVGLQCVLTGRQVRVTIVSQAGERAYTEFDTEV